MIAIHLNSTRIAFAPTLFYFIFGVETLLNIISTIIMPFAAASVGRAGVIHRNFRYCCIGATIMFEIGCLSRFFLLYYQINDLPNTDFIPVVGSIIRNLLYGYFCSVIGAASMERLVATVHSEWYEHESGTLHIFILVQAGLILPSLANSLADQLIPELLPRMVFFGTFFVQLSFSTISLFLLYKYNLHLIAKTGAQYDGYSVSRTFQLRENVRMLKYLIDIFLPIAVTTSVTFMFYFVYWYLSPEYDYIRFVCIALFEVAVAGEQVILFSLLIKKDPAIFKEFTKIRVVKALRDTFRKDPDPIEESISLGPYRKQSKISETDIYFRDLDKAWA